LFMVLATALDFDDPAKLGDQVAAIVYQILFVLLNKLFQAAAQSVAMTTTTAAAAKSASPSRVATVGYEGTGAKGIGRIIAKILADYAHRTSPRAAFVNDGLRCLLDGQSPADILSLIAGVETVFRGHTLQMKNPFSLPEAARKQRNHLLLLNMTVVFAPEGITFGSLLSDPASKVLLADMRSSGPPGMPFDRWFRLFDQALGVLSLAALAGKPVAVTAEIQITPSWFKEVRGWAHGPYNVIRSASCKELRDTYTRAGGEYGDGVGAGSEGEATDFANACFLAQLTVAKRMVAAGGISINQRGGYDVGGRTPLHCAAQKNHPDIAGWLVNETPGGQVADLNIRDPGSGATPLYMAAQAGSVGVVAILIKAGAEVNKARTDNGAPPLYAAAQNGHNEVVKLLLAAGTEVDKKKHNSETALLIAASNGHTEVIGMLLAAGADVNHPSRFGTPLKLARKGNHTAATEILKKSGGNGGNAEADDDDDDDDDDDGCVAQ
jgi:hypothetical protein